MRTITDMALAFFVFAVTAVAFLMVGSSIQIAAFAGLVAGNLAMILFVLERIEKTLRNPPELQFNQEIEKIHFKQE